MPTFQELQQYTGGRFLRPVQHPIPLAHALIDSRKLLFTQDAVFIAISGKRNNAHAYLYEVYAAGVRNFVIEEGQYPVAFADDCPDANILVCKSGTRALQALAALQRAASPAHILALTGSNGKTVVKEWLAHLLKEKFNLQRNPKSYNSQVGVPLSVLQLQPYHQLGIFEAGISEPHEMEFLEKVLQPNTGIFTYLGDAHDEGFSSHQQKLEEKAKLFSNCQAVVYPWDQPEVKDYFHSLNTKLEVPKYKGWSASDSHANFLIEPKAHNQGTLLYFQNNQVWIPFQDKASVWNASSAIAWMLMQGINPMEFEKRFAELPAIDMRLQLIEGLYGPLINDSYSADLGSLHIALDFLEQHAKGFKRLVLLSDFLESGKEDAELYAQIALMLKASKVDQLIGIGPAITQHRNKFDISTTQFYSDTKSFLQHFSASSFTDSIVLIKGARHFAFERIVRKLEKKLHQTVFEINLTALIHNLNYYRSQLNKQVKTMAMVKAFSYGSGSYEIARVLEYHHVDYLAVAYADEGVVLRKAGIRTPIMVMNPEASGFTAMLSHQLEPEIYNFEILNALLYAADGEEIGIHIELDTGMKRLGFDASQIDTLLTLLIQHPEIKVKSVFTHLAASEAPAHDNFTQQQISRFANMSQQLCEALPYPVLRHCLNSGGISRFPNAQFDMVRLGIGLYGVSPLETESSQPNLLPIGTLKTLISQIREIGEEESIGYGRKGKLTKAGKIAIVAIGYADGLDRGFSNGVGYMLVNGQIAPVVGNICMDMTMLDVSHIDCKVGDTVIVFGENPDINELSKLIQTIPYELLTGISQRVKRVYYE